MKKLSNKNKIALITGITGGIGFAIANKLSTENIYIIGITSPLKKKKSIIRKLNTLNNIIEIFECDLSNNDDVTKICSKINKKYKTPDIIINNAATFSLKNIENFSIKEINYNYNINIIAPIIICNFFIVDFKKRKKGNIINICSSSSYTGGGTGGHTIYASTKHALLGFSRALDEEVRRYNIRVGTISPAGVLTDMMRYRDDIDKKSLMAASEVADGVFYMLKSKGKGITYEMRIWRLNR